MFRFQDMGGLVYKNAYASGHPVFLLSTAANPLHEGHLRIARHIEKQAGYFKVEFEVPYINADKGELDRNAIEERMKQFDNHALGCYSSPCATFLQKSFLFKSCTFLIGDDTFYRLLNSDYYAEKTYAHTLAKISMNGCKFCVFPRHFDPIDIRRDMNKAVSVVGNSTGLWSNTLFYLEADFVSSSISSTELRKGN